MPEVANPAVIIGLGGTGKWVLTYLKKSLLDTYGGEIPATVRLLSFDTTTEKASRDGEQQEEDVRVGDTQLDTGSEFIYLGGNIEQICRDIRDKSHYPHIGSWLQAKTYLQATDSRAFDISGGAGQKRPFGRMAVFYDLQQSVRAQITNKISTAINDVISANKKRVTVEIYIVASLAGGTGAGMFIDVAHLARWFAAKHIRTGYAIRGFLALHNTFNTVINTNQVQPNAFAAMRELDRFMLVFDQQYPIVYNPSNPDLNTIYGGQHGKLFDNCYLLDATRERMPLDGVPPKYGVYPSIADAITMLLDGTTGETYTQHYVNVNNRIAEVQSRLKVPIYSSLGTFSLILPTEDIITSLSYRFASELLARHLLNLEERTNDAGQKQLVLVYEGDAKKEAAAFLQRSKSDKGLASTAFIQRVPGDVDNRSLHHDAAIADVANLEAGELLAWIIPPESDPTVEELANKVREDLQIVVATRVLTSAAEGDDPVEGCGRVIRGVRDFKEEFLGHEVDGRKVGGVYQKALERCRDIHRERYRKLLHEYLVNLLNGPAPDNRDYQKEKRGRLGQAQALLSHLSISYFNELSAFLDRIKARRAKDGNLQRAQENASLLRNDMEKRIEGGFWTIWFKNLHPAIKVQENYIEAEQDAIDIEVKDLFFEYLQQITRVLRVETEEFKATVDAWVNTLALGITGEINDPGLYHQLSTRAKRYQSQREEKETRFQNVREYMTDATFENNLYTAQTEGKFAEVLSGMIWGIEEQTGVKQLTLSGFAVAGTALRSGKSATERNADMLTTTARRYFEPLREKLNIADRLAEMDTLRLVRKLRDSCAAMIRIDPMRSGGEQDISYFVCANEGRQRSYFSEFRSELRQIGASARENQMLDSSNPYTCTILSTADVFTSAGLHAYITAEREYNQYRSDARLLHIFPAEINAVHFEQQLPTIKEERRRFSHTLTAMLENLDDVRRFTRAFLYRLIRLDAVDTRTSCWRLFTSASGKRNSGIFDLTPVEPQPTLLHAMETFAFRKAAFDNSTRSIDFELLDRELDRIEQEVSGGDWNRQINMFEDLIDQDIDPMRQSRDQNTHDLGSLMRLLVGEMLGGLQARLKNSGKPYDPDLGPLIDVRRTGQTQNTPSVRTSSPPSTVIPSPSETSATQAAMPINPSPATSGTAEGNLAKLREFHMMLQEGDLTQKGFLKKIGQLLEEGDILNLKEFYAMLQDGDMTEEGFNRRIVSALSKLG